jgi:hypothetical protein
MNKLLIFFKKTIDKHKINVYNNGKDCNFDYIHLLTHKVI